ncbi:MAG: DUF1778 domain-containing protein [Pirellulaceae bacterium]|nr:DUF1778 domain-containing protein [Pirellulaceae bacterium]
MQKNASLMVRLDNDSKAILSAAAELRRVSVSDYVRSVMVQQASRELAAARSQTIAMTPDEQLQFWKALSKTPKLTESQKGLAAIMRGEA